MTCDVEQVVPTRDDEIQAAVAYIDSMRTELEALEAEHAEIVGRGITVDNRRREVYHDLDLAELSLLKLVRRRNNDA
jgi:hypothetical protein